MPHEARRLSKGVFSWLKRIPPLEPPETTRGHPSTPHCLSLQGITARAAQRTACGFLLLLSIWSASLSAQPLLRWGYGGAQRSAAAAAGLRKASAFGDTAFLREKAVRKRARGRHPLTPELRRSNYRSAAVCKCTGAAQPRLLPLSIWSAPMSAQPLLRRGFGDVLFRRLWVNLHGYIKFALRRQRLAGRLLIPLTGCRIRGIHFLSAPRNTMPIIKCHIPPRRYHIVLPKKFAVPTVHARFSVFP